MSMEKIVTRFAPSPTGYLHVGGARTALFNWLLAKHTGGQFILRIEDTDQKRNTATATQQVINDLRWLGLLWDQGPEVGGPAGTYFQSERMGIYKEYLDRLIAEKKAYYCFDTPEEVQKLRDEASAAKKNFVYPRPDNFPGPDEVEQARAESRPVTVRFAMPDEEIVIEDVVRGTVKFAPADMSDFIIQKSDGFPTYHFACVVDDELMGVTHVIRGQEHLMNTPLHKALQQGLGFRAPVYAHMSVTVSPGGGKLSKRERPKTLLEHLKSLSDDQLEAIVSAGCIDKPALDEFLAKKATPDMPVIDAIANFIGVHLPEINVVDFFRSGYIPEAMVNFLALLGWNPGDDRQVMQIGELIESFDITRLNKANSLFDRNKLLSFNTEHIKNVDKNVLAGHFKAYLFEVDSPVKNADDAMLARIIEMNAGAKTLEQIEQKTRFAFIADQDMEYDPKAVKKVLKKQGAVEMLEEIKKLFSELDEISAESIERVLRDLAERKEVGLGKVAQPLRVAISGSTVSPPIFDSVDMLGMETTLKRIEKTINEFKDN